MLNGEEVTFCHPELKLGRSYSEWISVNNGKNEVRFVCENSFIDEVLVRRSVPLILMACILIAGVAAIVIGRREENLYLTTAGAIAVVGWLFAIVSSARKPSSTHLFTTHIINIKSTLVLPTFSF